MAVYLLVCESRVAVTFPSPMALGLRYALGQLALVGKTSSPFGAEVSGIGLAATRTDPQVLS
jgi:hypothetical protein